MKAVAVALIIIVATAVVLIAWARSPWGQGVREHYDRVSSDIVEAWADRPPRFEELIEYRLAKIIMAFIDFMD